MVWREGTRAVGEKCDCYELLVVENKMNFANMDEEFRNVNLDSYKTEMEYFEDAKNPNEAQSDAKVSKKSAEKFICKFRDMQKKGKGLYFHSKASGSGKTLLLHIIGTGLIKEHKAVVKFATQTNLLNAIRNTYRNNSEMSSNELVGIARRVEILIIDDMGQESVKKDTNDLLFDILNYREKNKKLTLFSSNCKIENLPFDYRINRRIKQMSIPIQAPEVSIGEYIAEKENEDMLSELLTE
jgi:DNA replication protein DnaC